MSIFNQTMMLIDKFPFGRRTIRRSVLACLTKKFKSSFIREVDGIYLALDLNQSLDKEYLIGKYDKHELAFLMKACEKGGSFVDIGANQGIYSLMIAKKYTACKVIAFEPDPYSVAKFRKNISLNNIENIVLIPK